MMQNNALSLLDDISYYLDNSTKKDLDEIVEKMEKFEELERENEELKESLEKLQALYDELKYDFDNLGECDGLG